MFRISRNYTMLQLFRPYHKKILEYYEKPMNIGSFNPENRDIGTGLVGSPACGDVMKIQIKVDKRGEITDAKFKTFGCGSAIASSSYVTELIKGKHINEAVNIKNSNIAKHLHLPPVKLHCSMLAEDAVKSAVMDFKKKNSSS